MSSFIVIHLLMTEGYIYCFSNESMPGILKVGMTKRTPDIRLAEANSSDTWRPPTLYNMEFAKKVTNPTHKEITLHKLLTKYTKRINTRREFFSALSVEVKDLFDLMDGSMWTEKDSVIDGGDNEIDSDSEIEGECSVIDGSDPVYDKECIESNDTEPIDKNYCEGKIMEVIDGKSYHGNCKYNQRNWFTKTYPGIYHIFHEYNEDHHMKRKFPGIYDTKDASIFCNNCILDEGLSKHRRACRVYRCLGH